MCLDANYGREYTVTFFDTSDVMILHLKCPRAEISTLHHTTIPTICHTALKHFNVISINKKKVCTNHCRFVEVIK